MDANMKNAFIRANKKSIYSYSHSFIPFRALHNSLLFATPCLRYIICLLATDIGRGGAPASLERLLFCSELWFFKIVPVRLDPSSRHQPLL